MLFHYKKSKLRQALTIGANILLLPVFLYLFSLAAKKNSEFEDVYPIAEAAIIVIGVVLVALLFWYLKSKKIFELTVTEDEFRSEHPLFSQWCFTVNPRDIKQIKHHLDATGGGATTINMIMHNGEQYQICMNYNYSRDQLYAALKKANPAIELPENSGLFKAERSKEMDEYVTSRFPLMSRIFKRIFRGNK